MDISLRTFGKRCNFILAKMCIADLATIPDCLEFIDVKHIVAMCKLIMKC